MTTTPMDVFGLIERADERIKYAQNRDAAQAYRQARESLDEATQAAAGLADERARTALLDQIARRHADLDRLESEPPA